MLWLPSYVRTQKAQNLLFSGTIWDKTQAAVTTSVVPEEKPVSPATSATALYNLYKSSSVTRGDCWHGWGPHTLRLIPQ